MIIKFESLDDFRSATANFVTLYDPKRKVLYTIAAGAILLYKPKSDEEVKELRSLRTVITARLIPSVIPDNIESYDKAKEEFKEDAPKIIGKKVKEVKIGDNGIDLVFEDGTTLEIYCFGEWAWCIDVAGDREDENMV